jgi:hypothetical protein
VISQQNWREKEEEKGDHPRSNSKDTHCHYYIVGEYHTHTAAIKYSTHIMNLNHNKAF